MADKRVTDLDPILQLVGDDTFMVVDISHDYTLKVTLDQIAQSMPNTKITSDLEIVGTGFTLRAGSDGNSIRFETPEVSGAKTIYVPNFPAASAEIVITEGEQTLYNKTLVTPRIDSIKVGSTDESANTHTIPNVENDVFVLEQAVQIVTNKDITDCKADRIRVGSTANTANGHLVPNGSNSEFVVVDGWATDANGAMISGTRQLLENKDLTGNRVDSLVVGDSENSHTVPDVANDVFTLLDAEQTLTNKNLTGNQIDNLVVESGATPVTLTFPNSASDNVVTLTASQTLSNKNLTGNRADSLKIGTSLVTASLPVLTLDDTLVAEDFSQSISNKDISSSNLVSSVVSTSNVVSSEIHTSKIFSFEVSDTKIGTATTQQLSFWNATPIAQPALISNLSTTYNVTGLSTINPTVVATALGDISTKVNSILTLLKNVGLMAS